MEPMAKPPTPEQLARETEELMGIVQTMVDHRLLWPK